MEMVLHLFTFFRAEEVPRLRLVCHFFNRLSKDEELWKWLFLKRFQLPVKNELYKRFNKDLCWVYRSFLYLPPPAGYGDHGPRTVNPHTPFLLSLTPSSSCSPPPLPPHPNVSLVACTPLWLIKSDEQELGRDMKDIRDSTYSTLMAGEWKGGRLHGYGIMIHSKSAGGAIYEGQWNEGKQHGYGLANFSPTLR